MNSEGKNGALRTKEKSRWGQRLLEIVLFVPGGEFAESVADGDLGFEAVVGFECSRVGVSERNVARLHADELAVRGKVV